MIRAILPERIRQAVAAEIGDRAVWLVGGAVRDHFLDRSTVDYDFTVAGDALGLARTVADALNSAYFTLDSERGTGRVIPQSDSPGWRRLDFAALRGATIGEDLGSRDFTVNAMALDLGLGDDQLIDPTGGLQDLKDRRLRLCAPDALAQDPIRALRAVRLAAELEFKLDPGLVRSLGEAGVGLQRVSPERIRDELFRIFEARRPSWPLRVLDQVGALRGVLPELYSDGESAAPAAETRPSFNLLRRLEALMGAIVGEYTEEAAADMTLGQASLRLGRFREGLARELAQELSYGRIRRGLLVMASVFAPVPDREALPRRAAALRLSAVEVSHLRKISAETDAEGDWLPAGGDRRALYRFFKRLGSAGAEVVLLALSRFLSRSSGPPDPEAWEAKVEQAREVLRPYFEHDEMLIDPPQLVRGDELMRALDLAPGPRIGELLEGIREAQAVGEVETREQALELARRLAGGGPDN